MRHRQQLTRSAARMHPDSHAGSLPSGMLKCWEKKAGADVEGEGGNTCSADLLKSKEVCYALLQPKYSHYTGVICSVAGGLHHRRKRDQEERRKEMLRTAPPVLTLQSPPSHLKKPKGNKRTVEENSQILKDQRAVSKHSCFLRRAGKKTCPPCSRVLHLSLLHMLWAPVL